MSVVLLPLISIFERRKIMPHHRSSVFALACLCALAVGCNSKKADPAKPTATAPAAADTGSEGRCRDLIQSVVDTFRLRLLGISSDLDTGVGHLNIWQQNCGAEEMAKEAPPIPKEVLQQLTREQEESLKEKRFTRRDGEHMRDCVLFKAMNSYAVGHADDELGRVVNLFQHVVRSLTLISAHAEDLPLTPYEIVLLGRGTVEDRAWIFAELLRQLKIDAVILSPQAQQQDPKASQGEFLVGVLLDEKIYLFDPKRGVPVPALKTDDAAPAGVATLEQAIADPAILKQFDVGEKPYGITAADLKQPLAAVVGDTTFWSGRMQALQSQLSGKQALIVYDGIGDSAAGPGLWSRVMTAGTKHWSSDSQALWKYPETHLGAYARLSPEQKKKLQSATAIWLTPFSVALDGQKQQLVFGNPEKVFLKMRLAQLNGNFDEAIRGFIDVRRLGRIPEGATAHEPTRRLHERAALEAWYWCGICQFEQGKFDASTVTFEKFLEMIDEGEWVNPCRYQLAVALVAQKNYAGAVKALEAIPEEDLLYFQAQFLIRQWTPLAAKTKAKEKE